MGATLFISYSRADMQDTDWLARLKMYLVPVSRRGTIDVWDDGRIAAGSHWKNEIAKALDGARAAVLLVGPGFLASDFIMEHELPVLLKAAHGRGVVLFPVVVGFCGYSGSDLQDYQAYNSPEQPLESLPRAEQNRILNSVAVSIDEALRAESRHPSASRPGGASLYETMLNIQRHLGDTRTAVDAQYRRRDALVTAVEQRLKFKNDMQYEKFFFRYHSQLSEEEKFDFDQIRAMTEGPLQRGNRQLLDAIEGNTAVLDAVPQMVALRQHLVFWLNKYDKVFAGNRAMCLLYTGVEDGVPFPNGIDSTVKTWLEAHKPV
jgi:hypothetical protein